MFWRARGFGGQIKWGNTALGDAEKDGEGKCE